MAPAPARRLPRYVPAHALVHVPARVPAWLLGCVLGTQRRPVPVGRGQGSLSSARPFAGGPPVASIMPARERGPCRTPALPRLTGNRDVNHGRASATRRDPSRPAPFCVSRTPLRRRAPALPRHGGPHTCASLLGATGRNGRARRTRRTTERERQWRRQS
ncbi:hypothetical protein SFR_4196 [Streptomyces sp. FR-008]|nr:hypothetical protein SFR_4196 [Streptomyces sp. FR-008]